MQLDPSNSRPCENCGELLPLTGTYCLACDTPVTGAAQGLSVAESHQVRRGRPIQAVAIVGGLVLAVCALGIGLYQSSRPHESDQASRAVTQGLGLLVRAESGVKGPCEKLGKYLHGHRQHYLPQCRALIGKDPGAHLTGLTVDHVVLKGRTGTAHVHATLVDDAGKRPYDRQLDLHEDTAWHLAWDGQPIS